MIQQRPTRNQKLGDYERIERAIHYLSQHRGQQPSLQQLANHLRLSPSHCQRLFSDWAGISPKRFVQYLTLQHTKELLRSAESVFESGMEAGLSSASRIHELFVACEAVTPGQYKARGDGVEIQYGFHATRFGHCLTAVNDRGLCALQFVNNEDELSAVHKLSGMWPGARLRQQDATTARVTEQIFNRRWDSGRPLYLNVKGTNFQIKVWEALLKIPSARLVSYQDLAQYLGRPRSARAIANAIAQNPIHYLIPCHRVIRQMGQFGGYQGREDHPRKKALHVWEAAQADQPDGR
jgi:AraC family transcriptional regulator of adaptative response/methylated-DNA-[protein]-cysteine methyltransferase